MTDKLTKEERDDLDRALCHMIVGTILSRKITGAINDSECIEVLCEAFLSADIILSAQYTDSVGIEAAAEVVSHLRRLEAQVLERFKVSKEEIEVELQKADTKHKQKGANA